MHTLTQASLVDFLFMHQYLEDHCIDFYAELRAVLNWFLPQLWD